MKKLILVSAGLIALAGLLMSQSIGFRNIAFVGSAGGAASFSPTDLSGCTLWLAADQAELSALNDGDKFATFTDHSTNGTDLTEATVDQQFMFTNNAFANGKPAALSTNRAGVRTDAYEWTRWVSSNEMSAFMLIKLFPDQLSTSPRFIGWNWEVSTNAWDIFKSGGDVRHNFSYESGEGLHKSVNLGLVLTNSQWWFLEFYKSNNVMWSFTNGVECSMDDTTDCTFTNYGTATELRVWQDGSTYGGNGLLAEMGLYNRCLQPSEAFTLRTYITNKYGDYPSE